MKLRTILVCTLLLLAASPSFAAVAPAPPCQACDQFNLCTRSAGSGDRCAYDQATGDCYTFAWNCVGLADITVAEEWTVASIEISRPSLDSITITAPAQVAEVREPKAQK
ncbi:MAG TPA: hypothetical protein VF618_23235 [Thermoanaerobaculia bacterium]